MPLTSEKRANLQQRARLIQDLSATVEWWKDLGPLLALLFSKQAKLVPSASHLSPGPALVTRLCCSHLLSQALDVTCRNWGPSSQNPCFCGSLIHSVVCWRVTCTDRDYIYWGKNTCCHRKSVFSGLTRWKLISCSYKALQGLGFLWSNITRTFLSYGSTCLASTEAVLSCSKPAEAGRARRVHRWDYGPDTVVTFRWLESSHTAKFNHKESWEI